MRKALGLGAGGGGGGGTAEVFRVTIASLTSFS